MKTAALAMVAALGVSLVACGGSGSGGGADAFTDQMSDACVALRDDLRALDTIDDLTDLDLVAEVSLDAGDIYNTAVGTLEKLSPDADHRDDFNELVDNMADQLDLLGDIADAADDDDNNAITRAITKFNRLSDANAKIARSAGSRTCAVASIFATDDTPTTTDPDTTDPITTDPETTDPVTTDTGGGLPPITVPPPTSATPPTAAQPAPGEKVFYDFVAEMNPVSGYTFVTNDDSYLELFRDDLNRNELTSSAGGYYGSIDMLPSDGDATQVYVFNPGSVPMAAGAVQSFAEMIAEGAPLSPATIGQFTGVRYTSSGTEFFMVGTDETGFFMFVSGDPDTLTNGVLVFQQAVAG